jgi:AraC family L-rhamnose operon regulatory protein RhaS
MVLAPEDLERLTYLLRHCEQPVWRSDKEVEECFLRMGSAVASDKNGSSISRLTVHINELFICLREMLERREPKLDTSLSTSLRTVQLFLETLAEQAAEDWTLEKMASQCGLGRSRFTHYCRQITNLSPMEYLTQSRLKLAQRMLREDPSLSVLDVAIRCGFQSGQYFATVFKKQYGCTPRDYRTGSPRRH